MYIKSEDADSVTLELTATEAGHIAADLLDNKDLAGEQAQALAELLKKQGYFAKLETPPRTEWGGPYD